MRIIAGEFKGRRVKPVPGMNTRPTADKVKGAVFNVLGEKVVGAKVLDLFSGTGNLAFEALSRGATQAVLVEKNRSAQQVISDNMENMGISERVHLVKSDAFTYLEKYMPERFDLIFLDPPYRLGLVDKALQALSSPCRLAGLGVIVAETGKDEEIVPCAPFELRKWGLYGDSKIWYLQYSDT